MLAALKNWWWDQVGGAVVFPPVNDPRVEALTVRTVETEDHRVEGTFRTVDQ